MCTSQHVGSRDLLAGLVAAFGCARGNSRSANASATATGCLLASCTTMQVCSHRERAEPRLRPATSCGGRLPSLRRPEGRCARFPGAGVQTMPPCVLLTPLCLAGTRRGPLRALAWLVPLSRQKRATSRCLPNEPKRLGRTIRQRSAGLLSKARRLWKALDWDKPSGLSAGVQHARGWFRVSTASTLHAQRLTGMGRGAGTPFMSTSPSGLTSTGLASPCACSCALGVADANQVGWLAVV